ncbi:MaoC family dehydratase [Paractinoplanes globisporus]|uniref:MaoC family dehydratase n=1 Tax=Paractinoplanes globisporus TaxID=113565 RepID=A0ABW6W8E6_9ACTN|nr:MaoC/PaaZ C-terminal domain-containing protein [Actinoplanes globisporus]
MVLKSQDLKVGDVHRAVVADDLTRTQLVQYCGASGDYNPLHSDEIYATAVAGYPSIFAHGMLTMGMAGRMLTDYVGDGRLLTFGGRFKAQVWPGDRLTATATVRELRPDDASVHLDVAVTNDDGLEVFAGYASARIDS